jgi:hypothetical protein
MMWSELRGTWGYKSGSSGSPTLPLGAQIIGIWAQGTSGTIAINGGDTLTFATEFSIRFPHLLVVAKTTTPVAFGSTTAYFIEYVVPS